MKLLPFAVLALVMNVAVRAYAQRNDVSGTIGRTFISDQLVVGSPLPDSNIHFGNGLTFEVNYARHFLDREVFAVVAEIPAIFNPNQRLHFGGFDTPSSFASYFVTPSARLHLFPETSVSPWVSVGGGLAHFSTSSRLESGQANPAGSTTTGVFQLGAGLDVRVARSVYLRGEVRELRSGEPALNVNTGKSRFDNLYAGGGLSFRF